MPRLRGVRWVGSRCHTAAAMPMLASSSSQKTGVNQPGWVRK